MKIFKCFQIWKKYPEGKRISSCYWKHRKEWKQPDDSKGEHSYLFVNHKDESEFVLKEDRTDLLTRHKYTARADR